MRKESVLLDHRAIASAPVSHTEHVRERNTNAGLIIAEDVLHIPFAGIGEPRRNTYSLLGCPIGPKRASQLNIVSRADMYRAVLDDPRQIGKAIFHPSVSGETTPGFHSAELAHELTTRGIVFPGVTAFRKEDLLRYFQGEVPPGSYRLKVTDGSDGEGQVGGIASLKQLQEALREMKIKDIAKNGIVLEKEVTNPQTISVGSIVLGAEEYTFLAYQDDEIITEDGKERTRYLGAHNITVARGGIRDLVVNPDSPEALARDKAARFEDIYGDHFPSILSRWSVDIVMDQRGTIGGITDLTTERMGGTDPALLLAIRELVNDTNLTTVTSEVVVDYGQRKDVPDNAVMFVDQPDLRLFAYITGKRGEFQLQ